MFTPWLRLQRIIVGLMIGIALITTWLDASTFLAPLHLAAYDRWVSFRAQDVPTEPNLRLIAIDDSSLEFFGNSGIRPALTRLARQLSTAKTVTWDIVFAADSTSDGELADAMSAGRHVLAVGAQSGQQGTITAQIPGNLRLFPHFEPPQQLERIPEFSLSPVPSPLVLEVATAIGHTFADDAQDGVQRAFLPVVRQGQNVYPALALATLLSVLDEPEGRLVLSSKFMTLQDPKSRSSISFPLNSNGSLWIDFLPGALGDMHIESLRNVLESLDYSDDFADSFDDSIILVGDMTSTGGDFTATPGMAGVPGFIVIANQINALLQGRSIRWLPDVAIWIWALVGTLMISMGSLRGTSIALASAGAFVSLSVGISIYSMLWASTFVSPVVPSLLSAILTLTVLLTGLLREKVRSNYMNRMIARTISPGLQQELETQWRHGRAPQPCRRELSILFADVQGFTTFSDNAEPEEIDRFLIQLYDAAFESIRSEHGTLDKFMGDGIMAFWGAPHEVSHKEQHAVRCAQKLQSEFDAIRKSMNPTQAANMALRCGIATGVTTVGYVGSAKAASYTTLGRTVNLAARLETAAAAGEILMDKRTARRISGVIPTVQCEPILVKGIAGPVEVARCDCAATFSSTT